MFNFPCDWKSGFVMDPTRKQRVGYLLAFNGIGLPSELPQDITVFSPFNAQPAYAGVAVADSQVKVVGVLDSFSWGGGVGDPISISAYISAENAFQLKALQQLTLKTTSVSKLAWWIADFDEETKEWFEQAYPQTPAAITGQLNAPGGRDIRLQISDDPTKVAANIDVNVYNVYFEVVPAANQTAHFMFATSKQKKVAKGWGLVVGTQAAAALAPAT